MLHPSYTELMAKINSEVEEGEQPLVQSRYSIVKASSERAKQIIEARAIQEKLDKETDSNPIILTRAEKVALKAGEPLIDATDETKPLSIAVAELFDGKVKIVGTDEQRKDD